MFLGRYVFETFLTTHREEFPQLGCSLFDHLKSLKLHPDALYIHRMKRRDTKSSVGKDGWGVPTGDVTLVLAELLPSSLELLQRYLRIAKHQDFCLDCLSRELCKDITNAHPCSMYVEEGEMKKSRREDQRERAQKRRLKRSEERRS